MNRPDARALIETLAEQAQRDDPGAGGEPGSEELLDYLRGDLPPDDEERVGRRLVADPAAARALLDLAELEAAATAADEGHVADPETRAGWRDLEARLPRAPQPPLLRFRLPPWLFPAVAALLLVAAVGLGVRVAQLERALGTPSVLAYEELGDTRGGEEPAEFAAGTVLGVEVPAGCAAPRVEIAGPNTEVTIDLPRFADRGGMAMIPLTRQTAVGSYLLRLEGCGPPAAEHRFRVVPPEGSDGG